MNRWLGLLLGLLLYVTGYFCYGTPLRWIEPLSFVHLLGTFFFFLFWLGSLWGWGRCLQSLSPWQQNPAWLSAVFGTFALMAVAFLLFLSPVISLPTKKLIALAFLVVGYLWTLPPNWKPPALSSLWSEHWTFMLLVLGCVALFVMLGLPHPFWDSMWYHLPASQHWYQQNAIVFNPSALVMTKGSFWEYLFLWSHLLLAKPGGFGLLTTQIFCQWIHICLGFFLSLWILHSLLTRIFNIQERYWLALLAMFCFTNYGLHYATLAPKPDWGVIA